MYFSEQGNVDDDATFITILLVSFNLQSCCLMQSAVCSLQKSYTVHFQPGAPLSSTELHMHSTQNPVTFCYDNVYM